MLTVFVLSVNIVTCLQFWGQCICDPMDSCTDIRKIWPLLYPANLVSGRQNCKQSRGQWWWHPQPRSQSIESKQHMPVWLLDVICESNQITFGHIVQGNTGKRVGLAPVSLYTCYTTLVSAGKDVEQPIGPSGYLLIFLQVSTVRHNKVMKCHDLFAFLI